MQEIELRHLSDLRALIESFAARHAAQRHTPAERRVPELRQILRRIKESVHKHDYPAFRRADAEFHHTIALAAGVPSLGEAWSTVWNALQRFHEQSFDECFPDARILIEEHEHLLKTLAHGDPVAAEDAARNHVEAVWFRLAEKHSEADRKDSDVLQRATAHLAFQLHGRIRLADVAANVAFTSPGNLSHLFRKRYRMGFQRYLQKLRMEKAASLLATTRLPIGIIAQRVGYRDPSRFTLHFKRHSKQLPKAWRKTADSTSSGR